MGRRWSPKPEIAGSIPAGYASPLAGGLVHYRSRLKACVFGVTHAFFLPCCVNNLVTFVNNLSIDISCEPAILSI